MSLGDLMKQAQAMQEKMQSLQADMANSEVEGQAGAGMVKVVMSGRHDVRSVTIDPSVMSEEKDVLEDLIAAAVNDAVRRIEELNKSTMGNLAAGLNLPAGFKFPF
jgi:nucleoid-associated protein EbfC